jgi:hypothetical protein
VTTGKPDPIADMTRCIQETVDTTAKSGNGREHLLAFDVTPTVDATGAEVVSKFTF